MSLWARVLNAMYPGDEYTVTEIAAAIHTDGPHAELILHEMKKGELVVRTFEGKYKRMPKS